MHHLLVNTLLYLLVFKVRSALARESIFRNNVWRLEANVTYATVRLLLSSKLDALFRGQSTEIQQATD